MGDYRIELLPAPWGDEARGVQSAIDQGRYLHRLEPRMQRVWAWRAACPAGAVLGVARDGSRTVRAAIAGVRHEVLLEGTRTSWIEVVDLLNEFRLGRGLARTRALIELVQTFAKEVGGRAPEASPVIYGLPNRRAHRIGLRRFGQEVLRSENVLVAPPETFEPKPVSGVEVEEVNEFPADTELAPLFDRWAADRGAIGTRSNAWLTWRFNQHPEREYRVVTARRGGELAGYLVVRLGEYAGHSGAILSDWVVPVNDPAAAWELLARVSAPCLENGSFANGGGSIVVAVPDKSPEWAAFQSIAFQAHGTREYMVFRGFQKPYIMSWLFSNWHHTLADTERG